MLPYWIAILSISIANIYVQIHRTLNLGQRISLLQRVLVNSLLFGVLILWNYEWWNNGASISLILYVSGSLAKETIERSKKLENRKSAKNKVCKYRMLVECLKSKQLQMPSLGSHIVKRVNDSWMERRVAPDTTCWQNTGTWWLLE